MGAIRSESSEQLKSAVHNYWNASACGTQDARQPKFSRAYFDEIEQRRYELEPFIFTFAQFPRHHGQKVLEIGMGAGTDFVQWARCGTHAYGVDLTEEAIEHVRTRLAVYGLPRADIRVADCEQLPFENDSFDVVYSWGVIHHTPNTARAVAEIIRVLKPGGTAKLMVYHRHSPAAFYVWVKWALLRGRPWHSPSWCFHHCVESLGTQVFSKKDVRQMLAACPVDQVKIEPILTRQDLLEGHGALFRFVARIVCFCAGGNRNGFFMTVRCRKKQ